MNAPAAALRTPSYDKAAAVACLLLNALVWGLCWWPLKQLEAAQIHPLWATTLMYALALLLLGLARPQAVKALATQPALWLLALASGITNVGFNWAVAIGDVVRVVLLFYTMPAWAIVLAWAILGERPNAAAFARLALALTGVALVLQRPGMGWPWPHSLADYLALMGGFSFALTNVLLRRLHGHADSARTLSMFAGGCLLALGVALLGQAQGWVMPLAWSQWTPLTLGLAGGLSVLFIASNAALQFAAPRLTSHTMSLIMLSEVVIASLSWVWIGDAVLTTRTLVGGALVMAAALLALWPRAAQA